MCKQIPSLSGRNTDDNLEIHQTKYLSLGLLSLSQQPKTYFTFPHWER